jgi:NAD(P)-dependent dehydrogenase (short-subunit alcohol dehydrogenase family)
MVSHGFRVYGTSRKAENGSVIDGIIQLRLDVCSNDSVIAAAAYLKEVNAIPDVLINNAGIGILSPAESVSDAEAREIFDTNFFGLINVTRVLVPMMRERGTGHIINISSIAAEMGLPFRGIYSASKSAVERYSEALDMELHPFGLRVTLVQPGDFNTGINDNRRETALVPQAYKRAYDVTRSTVIHEVANSPDPSLIGEEVARLAMSVSPPIRKRVAGLLPRLSPAIKAILPWSVFRKLILKRYT